MVNCEVSDIGVYSIGIAYAETEADRSLVVMMHKIGRRGTRATKRQHAARVVRRGVCVRLTILDDGRILNERQ
jgi:hypothetical protein